jgi:hypothetical protein
VGGEYSANIVYTHMQMKKMIAVDAIQAMGWGGIKESGGGWMQSWYIWYIVRAFVNATIYPHPTLQWKKFEKLTNKPRL